LIEEVNISFLKFIVSSLFPLSTSRRIIRRTCKGRSRGRSRKTSRKTSRDLTLLSDCTPKRKKSKIIIIIEKE